MERVEELEKELADLKMVAQCTDKIVEVLGGTLDKVVKTALISLRSGGIAIPHEKALEQIVIEGKKLESAFDELNKWMEMMELMDSGTSDSH